MEIKHNKNMNNNSIKLLNTILKVYKNGKKIIKGS